MAEPTDPQELAKVQAQDLYNVAAIGIEDLLDDFPNPTWNSTKMDTWLIDAVSHLTTCEQNWSQAGVTSKAWYKLEYSLITRVPDLSMDLVVFSRLEFNELVGQALDYDLDIVPLPVQCATSQRTKATALPSHLRQNATATHSWTVTSASLPAPSKVMAPVPPPITKTPASNATTPMMQVAPTPADKTPAKTVASTPQTTRPVVPFWSAANPAMVMTSALAASSNFGPAGLDAFFPPDLSMSSVQTSSSQLLSVDTATHASVLLGPDPGSQQAGSIAPSPNFPGPLFLPGTDDEEEQIQEDFIETGHVDDEVMGTDGEDSDLQRQDDDAPSSDKTTSPLPTKMVCRLCQEPKILFIFDDSTGDLVEPHLTIFLSRPVAPLFQNSGLCHSTRSEKKMKTVPKNKDKTSEVAIPHKRARNEDATAHMEDKPAPKKPKLRETLVINKDECEFSFHLRYPFSVPFLAAVTTKAVCKCGPGPSKPPPVTLGISGGGFGEQVPSSATMVKNGIKSIGVLVVDKDFGDFIEVDKSYWSKAVALFVGERYTTPCDHCRRLGTQCCKLLTHTIKCVRCHYSKLPCKVNGVAALNPIDHYRPKGSDVVNTFEGALNTIEANNTAISVITQQYLAGLSVVMHTNSIHAQTFYLRRCLAPVDEDEDINDSKDLEDKVPDTVAEGVAGPSKKQKHKSG
ncbi:hypothetical protein EDD85DRAFT_952791 [Armillaria nabsnona]|nr:hypothetical protein EDD85DRAFT_952791 [Armillaria nabsnona]